MHFGTCENPSETIEQRRNAFKQTTFSIVRWRASCNFPRLFFIRKLLQLCSTDLIHIKLRNISRTFDGTAADCCREPSVNAGICHPATGAAPVLPLYPHTQFASFRRFVPRSLPLSIPVCTIPCYPHSTKFRIPLVSISFVPSLSPIGNCNPTQPNAIHLRVKTFEMRCCKIIESTDQIDQCCTPPLLHYAIILLSEHMQ